MSIIVNYTPFVDWKNVQCTLAIQDEMLSFAAEPRGNLLFDYLRCTIYVLFMYNLVNLVAFRLINI